MKLEYAVEDGTLYITLHMGYANESTIAIPLKELQLETKAKTTRAKSK